MKRYVRSTRRLNKFSIEIIAVLNIESELQFKSIDTEVAVSYNDVTIEYRDLDFKYQLSQTQLSAYQNFVRSALSIVKKFGFEKKYWLFLWVL